MLSEDLNVRFASFGDFVRKEAGRNGVSNPTREQLQDIGQSLATTDMPGFCRAVLKDARFVPGEALVVDGIRHLDAVKRLRQLVPQQSVKLVYIAATTEERIQRGSLSLADVTAFDSHVVESENASIIEAADFVLNASGTLEESFAKLQAWVRMNCATE